MTEINDRKAALEVLRKYESRPVGYDEYEIVSAMIEFAERYFEIKVSKSKGKIYIRQKVIYNDAYYWVIDIVRTKNGLIKIANTLDPEHPQHEIKWVTIDEIELI